MATLHLRNVPAEIDAALVAEAKAHGVSKNRRAIDVLRRGLQMDQVARTELVAAIRRARRPISQDVAELIRQDRPGGDA